MNKQIFAAFKQAQYFPNILSAAYCTHCSDTLWNCRVFILAWVPQSVRVCFFKILWLLLLTPTRKLYCNLVISHSFKSSIGILREGRRANCGRSWDNTSSVIWFICNMLRLTILLWSSAQSTSLYQEIFFPGRLWGLLLFFSSRMVGWCSFSLLKCNAQNWRLCFP